ncbi:MAG TPA: phage antirepressor N-terminal domain-containing protein [Azospirillaceae bacterium]|nr:phage antirepressor N-terminal domain-containing protein [Azospirillaceae bacterium]HRQ81939.1 phage antirepressor N-terminal domain-containing protein [Azospirillaceae bacterium]
MSASLIPIDFHSDRVFVVEQDGEAFVPMRPICENIGLDWKSQHAKLMAAEKRWCVVIITTHDAIGRHQEMTCLPLRRLFGWLMSIHPSKVRPDLRDKLIVYQRECDDVLHRHFSGQHSAREQAMSEELAALRQHNAALAVAALAAKPLWAKIKLYVDAGRPTVAIRALTSRSMAEFTMEWTEMAHCGLVPHCDQYVEALKAKLPGSI